MTPHTEIHHEDPALLGVHPGIRHDPEWADDDPRFLELCRSMQEHGVIEPFIVDEKKRVMSGRTRRRAAVRIGLKLVPTVRRPEAEVHAIAIHTNKHRRHLTPSQMAFELYPHIAAEYELAVKRRTANLKAAGTSYEGPKAPKTVEDLAEEIGVSRDTLIQARKVHELLDADTKPRKWGDEENEMTARQYFTKRIMAADDGIGLGSVINGLAGKAATDEKQRTDRKPADLIAQAIAQLSHRLTLERWAKLAEREQAKAAESFSAFACQLPDPVWDKAARARAQLKKGQ